MKRYIFISILAMALTIGCDKSDNALPDLKPNQPQEGVQDVEDTDLESGTESTPIFKASFENENKETRTFIDESIKLLWSADDEISVFYHDSFNRKYRFDGNTGDDRGSFSYAADAEVYKGSGLTTNYAVYPYVKETSIIEDGTISLSLPAVQKYAPKSFGVGANMMVAVTKDKDDYYLPFKNICGYLKLKLYGDVTVKSIKLQGENKEPIAGAATVSMEYNKTPILIMGEEATSTITLDCGNGVTLGATEESATEFWLVVPPTNFEKGFTISVVGIDGGESFSMTTKALSIERNTVLSMGVKTSFNAEYTNPSSNAIWYTTTDGMAIDIDTGGHWGNSIIISNTYKNGRGVILFDNDITKIPYCALGECNNLSSITIPSSVTVIEYAAFWGCSSLASINIPSSVTEIGDYAFRGCSNSLASINIPSSVTVIGEGAFWGYGGELTVNCNIPDGYSSNSPRPFDNAKFTKVTIGDGVTKIGSYAFYDCSSITSITIPSSVTEIGYNAFYHCGGALTANCNIRNKLENYSSYFGAFDNANFTEVTIGDGVTLIGSYAFSGCSSITNITIPNSVTVIGDSSFRDCSSITSITIPSSVTEIGNYAFSGCGGELTVNCNIPDYAFGNGKFTVVTIGEGVTKIGDYTFRDCSSITSITIPSSVTKIGSYAFYGCSSLKEVYCKPITPPSLDLYAFAHIANGCTFYVPTESAEAYKSSWSSYANSIVGYTFTE